MPASQRRGGRACRSTPTIPQPLYRVVGYRIAGSRAVRIDILERLADLIRPLIAWRATPDATTPPDGAVAGNGFTVTVAMTSLLGCSGEDFASVLRALGYRSERKPAPPSPQPEPEPVNEQASTATDSAAAPVETDGAFTPSNDNFIRDASALPSSETPADDTATDNATDIDKRRSRGRDGRTRLHRNMAARSR